MITAEVELTQALRQQRQFVAQTGSGHNLLLDDAAGGTGPKPIELVAAGLAAARRLMSSRFSVRSITRRSLDMKFELKPIRQSGRRKYLRRCTFTTS